MENHVFLHGSSEGQSTIIPSDCPASICNDIADKYFKGRTLRREKSDSKTALFVDLYSSNGRNYSVYSYVNNECRGKKDREGQYIAISIICEGIYVYPESVFRMLHSAYNQMFDTKKVLYKNDNGEDQFVLVQFSEQKDYFEAFLKKIREVFPSVASNQVKEINVNGASADYDSWNGSKVCIDNCNSISTFENFCNIGRLYISEEYESPSEKIKSLEVAISGLQRELEESKKLIIKEKNSGKVAVKNEIEELKRQLQEKENEIGNLVSDNTNYKSSIEIVNKELAKYSKAVARVEKVQNPKILYKQHDKKDLLKILLLIAILCFTIISSIFSYLFFRHISSDSTQQEQGENHTEYEERDSIAQGDHFGEMITLEIDPSALSFDANKGSQVINVKCDSDWSIPSDFPDWVSLEKVSSVNLSVSVIANTEDAREYRFMICSGNTEKQVKIIQEGKTAYGVVVSDAQGKKLQSGSTVVEGTTVKAKVSSPGLADDYGWRYNKCEGKKGNFKEVSVKITGSIGETATFSYGKGDDRQKISLKIVAQSEPERIDEHQEPDPQ